MNSYHSGYCVCGKLLKGHGFDTQRSKRFSQQSLQQALKLPRCSRQSTLRPQGISPTIYSEPAHMPSNSASTVTNYAVCTDQGSQHTIHGNNTSNGRFRHNPPNAHGLANRWMRCTPTSHSKVIVIVHKNSTIHKRVPLEIPTAQSNETVDDSHFALNHCDSERTPLEIPSRNGAETQCNLLPPSSHMRQLIPLWVTRPLHDAHELWGRERRGACPQWNSSGSCRCKNSKPTHHTLSISHPDNQHVHC